jgi:hypothetical protein
MSAVSAQLPSEQVTPSHTFAVSSARSCAKATVPTEVISASAKLAVSIKLFFIIIDNQF